MSHKKQKVTFKPATLVRLKPNSRDYNVEFDEDRTDEDWEDLYPDYDYTVETVEFHDQADEYDGAPSKIVEFVRLVHTAVCGGRGYLIPVWRFEKSPTKTNRKRSPRNADGTLRELPKDYQMGDSVWLLKGSNKGWANPSDEFKYGEELTVKKVDTSDNSIQIMGSRYWYSLNRFTKNKPEKS